MLVLLARATSPATFGLVSVVIAASAALALADLGLQPLATRLYAIRDDHPQALRAMFMQRTLLCAVALVAIVACAAAAAVTDLPW
ncbi:oligosaccharide flippase family protein, partial [Salmonella enterica]|uniref:oligosaccharide flippase family protein n=1 Tax=Salmonella enterica TaxID=28901 RepID=UPI00159B93A5